ncbi:MULTISPECIES: patatin-like phospholipase family protein [Prosthecochloris]|uniref:Patatin-like phospholipase family protein n=1 Tax=Prosthecochloris vibrioformis TaxID=1098 RepID=A0A5C4S0Q1_PROVB|nr:MULTISPECIES: patatin-like phospholipase family protein [Prosthecochloris]ANT64940.1 NTE family protein RssA [Prosthecochloris sp. CIB 2401]TNJ36984.1 patatin-like phospholipase family protein [Prosthecochloris vibrioformis]
MPKGQKKGATISLALGGGAVLGAAHVGILRALNELDITVSSVAGNSIGSFIAALHAFGKSWQEIADISRELDWFDLSGLTLSQYGLLSNKKFGGLVQELLGDARLEHARIPLAMIATNISTGSKVVMDNGYVASAVMASSCIPGLFRPVERNGMLLVDGVLVENVPVSPLLNTENGPIICVDLMGKHRFSKPENIVGVLLNAFYSALQNTTEIQLEEADLVITPDIDSFSLVDTSAIAEIMEVGYQSSKKVLQEFSTKSGLITRRQQP